MITYLMPLILLLLSIIDMLLHLLSYIPYKTLMYHLLDMIFISILLVLPLDYVYKVIQCKVNESHHLIISNHNF